MQKYLYIKYFVVGPQLLISCSWDYLGSIRYVCIFLTLTCLCTIHIHTSNFLVWLYFLFFPGTELRALDLQTGYFTLRQIKAATSNFDPANKIGEGGFGPVYKVTMAVLSMSTLENSGLWENQYYPENSILKFVSA